MSQILSSAKGTRFYRKNYSKRSLAVEEEKWAFSSLVYAEKQRQESQVNSALNLKVTEAKGIMDPLLIFSFTAKMLCGCSRRYVLIDIQVRHFKNYLEEQWWEGITWKQVPNCCSFSGWGSCRVHEQIKVKILANAQPRCKCPIISKVE